MNLDTLMQDKKSLKIVLQTNTKNKTIAKNQMQKQISSLINNIEFCTRVSAKTHVIVTDSLDYTLAKEKTNTQNRMVIVFEDFIRLLQQETVQFKWTITDEITQVPNGIFVESTSKWSHVQTNYFNVQSEEEKKEKMNCSKHFMSHPCYEMFEQFRDEITNISPESLIDDMIGNLLRACGLSQNGFKTKSQHVFNVQVRNEIATSKLDFACFSPQGKCVLGIENKKFGSTFENCKHQIMGEALAIIQYNEKEGYYTTEELFTDMMYCCGTSVSILRFIISKKYLNDLQRTDLIQMEDSMKIITNSLYCLTKDIEYIGTFLSHFCQVHKQCLIL